MRYGVCFGVEEADYVFVAEKAGFDYVECSFRGLARADENVFNQYCDKLKQTSLLCEAANCFIPGDLLLIGPEYNEEKLREYIETGMRRGCGIGLKNVVFGSGGARSLPEGFSYRNGFLQLGAFLREVASPIAAKYGMNIVIEPLRPNECNFIHTLNEGVMLAALSGCDNISTLADLYHMVGSNDTYDNLRQLRGCIRHAHISYPAVRNGRNRVYPADINEYDYKGFIDALTYAGCETCSIEAATEDFYADAPVAAKVLRSI